MVITAGMKAGYSGHPHKARGRTLTVPPLVMLVIPQCVYPREGTTRIPRLG